MFKRDIVTFHGFTCKLELFVGPQVGDSCFLLFRIPLPELKDSDKLDKIMYMKEATKRIRLGPDNLPSICFYSFLNAYQVINNS